MQLLRIHEVTERTGLSRSSIYKQMQLKNFPKGVKITGRSIAWSSQEIDLWVSQRIAQRGGNNDDA